jgi:hypothetical protein
MVISVSSLVDLIGREFLFGPFHIIRPHVAAVVKEIVWRQTIWPARRINAAARRDEAALS